VTIEKRELYASPNGDRWYLARYPETGRVFVQHVPNIPSGGQPSTLELAEFLGREGNPPEQQALLRLIGTMVDGTFEAGTSANSNAKA
jgi:hypothetical protein